MAKLVKCGDCKHEISKKAKACPNCGAPAKKRTHPFTKLIAIILLGSLGISIFLGGTSPSSNSATKITPPQPRVSSNEKLIPRSMTENAKYYLVSTEKEGKYLKTVHRRTSSASTGYSATRIDCNSKRYMDLGYGDNSASNIKMYDKTQWTDLVPGSSKSDLVNFVCR